MRVLFLTAVALGALMAPCHGQEVPAINPDDGATVHAAAVRHHRKPTPEVARDHSIKLAETPASTTGAPQESDAAVATLASVPAGSSQGPNGSRYPHRPPPHANPINQAPVRISGKEARGVAITRHWRRARSMPSTGSDGAVVFTFGATQASIVCAPLTVCLLKLQAGEHVLPDGLQIGDKARWHIAPALGGDDRTILTIKPTDSSLRTTLAIVTNRRVYSIRLVSVPDEAHSMAISEFSYPDEAAEAWRNYYEIQEQKRQDNTLPNGRNIANLDFNYAISGDNLDWRPERIYSDGVHTYIQFPDRIRSSEMPSLLALGKDGTLFTSPSTQLVNYRRQGNTFLVDKVLGRAELIVGVGFSQQRVVITHVGG